jgi:hypothetical protein
MVGGVRATVNPHGSVDALLPPVVRSHLVALVAERRPIGKDLCCEDMA